MNKTKGTASQLATIGSTIFAAMRTLAILYAVALMAPAAHAQIMAPGGTFPVGADPYDVAVGDLNLDGAPDIAVANAVSNNVSILLNNGDGTFATQQTISTGTSTAAIALTIADLNADGLPDMALITAFTGSISIYLGDGLGGFGPPNAFPVGAAAENVAVGDLNADGAVDLAVTNANDNTVSILLGAGDGTFSQPQQFPTLGIEPFPVAMGDLDGDGDLDLAISNLFSDNVLILYGAGDGTFPTHQILNVGTAPYSTVISDLDGDGDQDVVAANSNAADADVSILLNNGDGSFAPQQTFPAGVDPFEVVVGDFNGDGVPDLATVSPGQTHGEVSILLGNGDGTFVLPQTFPVGLIPLDLATGDFDSDGDLDVVVTSSSDNNVSILLNTTNAPAPTSPADFNGDGVVNGADLAALLTQWGPCPTPPASCPADIAGTGDGLVNGGDLAFLLINWGPVN